MIKSLLKSVSALIAVAILFTACKKEKDQVTISKESISGSYKVTKVIFKDLSGNEDDITEDFMDECEMDNITTLNTNGTFTTTDEGVKCTPEVDYEGEWEFISTTEMKVDGESAKIISFDGTVFVTSTVWETNGIELGEIITHMKKQ